jgi:signal transduction histidine kinase
MVRGNLGDVRAKAFAVLVGLNYKHTIVALAVMFSGAAAVTLWHFSNLSSRLVEAGALQGTALYAESVKELRVFYNTQVVERVRENGIEVTHDYQTKPGAIPIPATFTIEFGKHISKHIPTMRLRMYSDYPFPFRKEGSPLDDFQREALHQLRQQPNKPYYRFEDYQGLPSLRYATAVTMGAGCVACHNRHPASPKTDWKLGDVRGVQEIVRPLDELTARTQAGLHGTFLLLATMGCVGLGGFALVFGKLHRNSVQLREQVAALAAAQRRLRSIYDVNSAINSTLDLRSVLDLLMENVLIFFPGMAVQIWLVNLESGKPERAACRNIDETEWKTRRLTKTPDLVEEALIKKAPVYARNVETDPRVLDPEFYRRQGVVSYLGVPMIAKGETVGHLVLLAREQCSFGDQEVEFFSTLAGHAAAAIHNSQLFEEGTRRQAELERSNTELQQFAYVASHDLQEPLRMITGYTNLLSRRYKGKLDDDADEFIAFAVDGANRMRVLINDLLTYSRVGTQGKNFAPMDCELILGQTLAGLQVAIQECAARVTHDPLPVVNGDDIQLGQLFQNLIGNALKYHNGNAPTVHIGCQRRDNDWLISISDNGIGIDPRFAAKIFVIFQRLHNREQYPGTGIGLALCKRIVDRHGGKIWVDSEPGKGSTFYFTLPA